MTTVRHLLLAAATLMLALTFPPALQAMKSADCLSCHGDADRVGEPLHLDPQRFDTTAHAVLGCPACHDAVADQHPYDGLKVNKARCRDCHEQIATEYARSLHGINATCGDCHNPHVVQAPSEVSGFAMNRQCLACHSRSYMVATHTFWLPQAAIHLKALPCITCHSASENYAITFYLISREGGASPGDFEPVTYARLQDLAAGISEHGLVDTNADSFISLDELRAFHHSPAAGRLRLQGMMVPEQVTHSFDILENRWDCSFCHAAGPASLEASYLALPQQDGSFRRIPIEEGALRDALYGTPDFYMIGAGRNRTLDLIALVIILGGLALPAGHGLARLLTRRKRRRDRS